MDFVYNELSLEAQFATQMEAVAALREVLAARALLRQQGFALKSPRGLLDRPVTSSLGVRNVIRDCPDRDLRKLLTDWLTREGPFWDDEPQHSGDDWLEYNSQIVSESGIAEAAVATARGLPSDLVSTAPSKWEMNRIDVDWVRSEQQRERITLANYWELETLSARCKALEPPVASWSGLVDWAHRHCPRLHFSPHVVAPLARSPFGPGAARRFQELLVVLDRVRGGFDAKGHLTPPAMELLQLHFVGEKAWFSDSSDKEKAAFENKLTFPHPERPGSVLFCPWHGKVKIEQMRVHFTYPITATDPLYVVYIGPKITKW